MRLRNKSLEKEKKMEEEDVRKQILLLFLIDFWPQPLDQTFTNNRSCFSPVFKEQCIFGKRVKFKIIEEAINKFYKMPLIVVTGVPSSGKTTRAQELKDFFEIQGKEVNIISEYAQIAKAGFTKNAFYADSNKEKNIRGLLKSEVLKLISPSNVVILDALNYIKGYRYELFCGTKASKSTQCTVHTEINRDIAWEFNEKRVNPEEKYSKEIFNALVMRYEDPDGKNRWDSPLFTTYPDATLPLEEVYSSLFKKGPPKPNMSTQNPPLSSTNFLYDLDRITKNITDELIKAKNEGHGGEVRISGSGDLSIDLTNVSIQQIMLARRQYISYSKMHTPDEKCIPDLFVQYLKTALKSL